MNLDDAVNELFQGLEEQFKPLLEDLWEDNKEQFLEFAKLAGKLQLRVYNKERITTAASALEDVVKVGIPQLAIQLRYKIESETIEIIKTALTTFFYTAISLAIAAGKAYLSQHDIAFLREIV